MAIRIEVAGTDRALVDSRHGSLTIERRLAQTGRCRILLQSRTASWRPALYDDVDIWEPVRLVTDAEITSGDATLTSATAAFVAGDVGDLVRVSGAGAEGFDLYAQIASRTSATEVELDVAASASVTGATCLIGTCRFRGWITDLGETRIGHASNTREFPVSAIDLASVTARLYPRLTRSAERIKARITALVDDDADLHGVTVYWPTVLYELLTEAGDTLITEAGDTWESETYTSDGGMVAAATYDGAQTLAEIFDDLMLEEDMGRVWMINAAGQVRALIAGDVTLPQALSSADDSVRAVRKRWLQSDYRNRQIVRYGTDLASSVAVEDATEIAAVGPFEALAEDSSLDLAGAQTYASNLLAQYADRTRYQLEGLTTYVDGIEPGQSGTITVAEHDVSGTHLVQEVIAEYLGLTGLSWRFELVAVLGDTRQSNWLDYFTSLVRV